MERIYFGLSRRDIFALFERFSLTILALFALAWGWRLKKWAISPNREEFDVSKSQPRRRSSVKVKADRAADIPPAKVITLTAKTQHLIDAVATPFRSFVTDFATITQSRADLAPQFMRAFNSWAGETGSSFVAFVRMIVPDVPSDRDKYRNHPAYQAAMYLRRLLALEETKETAKRVKPSERPVTPLQALAKLVATVLPTIDPNGVIWNAFIREMHWSDEQAARTRRLAERLGPLTLKGRQASILVGLQKARQAA